MSEQLGLAIAAPTPEPDQPPPTFTPESLSYILTPTPHYLLDAGQAMQGRYYALSGDIGEVTLWFDPTLAPLPAPPEQSNTWIATFNGVPIHDFGLPHRRDALKVLAVKLNESLSCG